MDDETNVQMLTAALAGTGCDVPRARTVWALNANLTDDIVNRLAGWAELEFLMADCTDITNAAVPILSRFPLTDLSVGETSITADAILAVHWPQLQNLGISGIDFSNHLIDPLLNSTELTVVNANGSNLDQSSVLKLASLPNMKVLEADSADITRETAKDISLQYSQITFRFNDGIWRNGRLINPHKEAR